MLAAPTTKYQEKVSLHLYVSYRYHQIFAKAFVIIMYCFTMLYSATSFAQSPQPTQELTTRFCQYVNPFIGTSGKERSLEGRTNPAAQLPFGMISVCPFNAYDTSFAKSKWDHSRMAAPYFYGRPFISGFSHVNLSGVGCPEMGIILLMPTTGEILTEPEEYYSFYSHETAKPGYYTVILNRYGVKAEMTATTRTGISRYHFPAGRANILLNLGLAQSNQRGAAVRLLSADSAEGYRMAGRFCGANASQKIFFALLLNKRADQTGTWSDKKKWHDNRFAEGNDIGAYFSYDLTSKESIEIKMAISYVSTANAWENLKAEQPGFNFDLTEANATNAWEKELSKVQATGGTKDDKTIFYTALYHTLIHPNILNDFNGEYPGFQSGKTLLAKGYTRYSTFSLWDTYRNLHPLFTLLFPERQHDMMQSMLEMYNESGWLPKWEMAGMETNVMVGDPATIVIVDSYLKGITNFDIQLAYDAMKKSAMSKEKMNALRPGIDAYDQYGYIPMDVATDHKVWGEVSTTLEYNLADFALSALAKKLDQQGDDDFFYKRSLGYQHLFNRENGFLAPKNKNGSWYTPFDPLLDKWPGGPGYVEGNAWHYNFFVPHDIPAFIKHFPTDKIFVDRLQSCFDSGYFSMGNEPDIAYPFLFNYVKDEAWRTQLMVKQSIGQHFSNDPTGIPGNDDCGTMSAWLVFAMMGFYPDCPAKTQYQLCSPLFDTIRIQLNRDFYPAKSFVIQTQKNKSSSIFIESIKLNGKSLNRFYIDHAEIVNGGKLDMKLSNHQTQ